MDELAKLIKEQKHDMLYGHKAWPEFRATVSLDRLKDMYIDVDSDGQIPMFSYHRNTYNRTLPRTGIRRYEPHETRCKRHPGEARRTKKGKLRADGTRRPNGQAYCAGCRREYRERMKDGSMSQDDS